MKAAELRIGNYYQPTDGSAAYAPVTIDDLVAWSSGAVYGKLIPLTEDWLVKFGFENNFGRYYKREGVQINLASGNVDLCESYFIPYKLLYVHQLQNLYHALTGTELEAKE